MPATTNPTTATSEGNKAPDIEEPTVDPLDVSSVSTVGHQHLNMIGQFVPAPLVTRNKIDGKGKQRSEPADNTQSLPLDAPAPSAKLHSSLELAVRSLGNHPTSTELSYRRRHAASPDVVEVHAARGFQVTSKFLFLILAFLLQLETTETCRKEAQTQDKEQAPCTTWKRLVDGGYIITSGVCSYTTCMRLVPWWCNFAGWSCASKYIITTCWRISVAYCGDT